MNVKCKLFGHDFFVYPNYSRKCSRCGFTLGVTPEMKNKIKEVYGDLDGERISRNND